MGTYKVKEAFESIVAFIDDLWEEFGNETEVSPLLLYHRMTEHIKFSDTKQMEDSISGFKNFFKSHEKLVIDDKLSELPSGTIISYGGENKKIYIEISKFIEEGTPETKSTIAEYLLSICAIINPDEKTIVETLEKKSESRKSNNDDFAKEIMQQTSELASSVDNDADPAQAIMGLFSSGIIPNMITGIQEGVNNGNMDLNGLINGFQNQLSLVSSPQNQSPKAAPKRIPKKKNEK